MHWVGRVPALSLIEEGLFFDDGLAISDPAGFEILDEYARSHELRLLRRSQFVREVFDKVAYRSRALVVGYNLPFDLSRLAVAWGAARTAFHGGFSLLLHRFVGRDGKIREDLYRPRIGVKTIDSKRHLMGFARQARHSADDLIPDVGEGPPVPTFVHRGHFLDLHTLVFALTNSNVSLAKACEIFRVDHPKAKTERHGHIDPAYIDYNRRDVLATAELFERAMAELARHPIDLQATKVFSPASIGKGYLREMGIRPILERQPDFPKEVLAAAMNAYYGGRSECQIRRTIVPVAYVDFLSMYPTVNTLMGLWRFIVANRIAVEDQTEAVRAFLEDVDTDQCLRPETWLRFPVLVQVLPDGDVLPARVDFEGRGEWQIGINPLGCDWPMWYALPDVVAAKFLGGKPPKILRALALIPSGIQEGLRPLRLRGEVAVDPARQDFFKTVIEERRRLATTLSAELEEHGRLDRALKVQANSTSYGIFAQFVRRELGSRTEEVRVWGLDGTTFTTKVSARGGPR